MSPESQGLKTADVATHTALPPLVSDASTMRTILAVFAKHGWYKEFLK